jgi:DNA-binding LacI/PurR family transcriptional regulator
MNLQQVARRAKVSTATVSRVINNASVVRNATRTRVLRAIEELKYHPNLQARSLAGGKSNTIGVIVSNLENPFFFDIYKTIEAQAHEHGYEVLMANTDYRPEQLVASLRLMIGRRVDGLAPIVSEMEPALIAEVAGLRIPVVFYDVGTPSETVSSIRVNYVGAVTRVLDHLYGLGHRRFGFVGHHSMLAPLNERMNTVLEAVSRRPGLEVRTAADEDTLEGGRRAAHTLFASGFDLTALVCVNDLTAVGALRAVRELGRRVPEDISVTGFDNVKLAEFCYPPLTTVDIPRERIGQIMCSQILTPRGTPPPVGKEVLIEPTLIVRASTGPARVGA